jgi:hypothetical protein
MEFQELRRLVSCSFIDLNNRIRYLLAHFKISIRGTGNAYESRKEIHHEKYG